MILCNQSYTVKHRVIYSIMSSCAKYGFLVLQKNYFSLIVLSGAGMEEKSNSNSRIHVN